VTTGGKALSTFPKTAFFSENAQSRNGNLNTFGRARVEARFGTNRTTI